MAEDAATKVELEIKETPATLRAFFREEMMGGVVTWREPRRTEKGYWESLIMELKIPADTKPGTLIKVSNPNRQGGWGYYLAGEIEEREGEKVFTVSDLFGEEALKLQEERPVIELKGSLVKPV